MKNCILSTVAILCAASSMGVAADVVTSRVSPIERVVAYAEHGGGDVAIWTTTGINTCPTGVYLSAAAPGFQVMASFVLSAYMAKTPIAFQVYTDHIWTGSKYPHCEVQAVRFAR